jgi:hypothetical protein
MGVEINELTYSPLLCVHRKRIQRYTMGMEESSVFYEEQKGVVEIKIVIIDRGVAVSRGFVGVLLRRRR